MEIEIKGKEEVREIKEPNRQLPWKVRFLYPTEMTSHFEEIMEKAIMTLKKEILPKWAAVFPREETLAWKYDVPSLIVRVDFTVDSDVYLYEVEDSPAGIGMAKIAIQKFGKTLQELGLMGVTVIVPPREKGGDDYLWASEVIEVKNDEDFSKVKTPMVAPRIENLPSWLIERSIWPVKYRKDKSYLERFGGEKWDGERSFEVIANEYENSGKEGIVFQVSPSSKTEGTWITLFKPAKKEAQNWLKKGKGEIGIWSLKRTLRDVQEEIKQGKTLYLREFRWPIKVVVNGSPQYGIIRYFFGFSTKKSEWMPLGGFLNTRPSLLIHGASDSFFVPITAP
jgi:hypothetical protein